MNTSKKQKWQWGVAIFLALGALANGFSFSSFLLLISAFFMAPIPMIREHIKGKLAIILSVILFFVGGLFMPSTTSQDEPLIQTESISSESISEPEISTEELPTVFGEPEKTESAETIPPENSSFTIHFINVGQADAALVQCDGKYMLIDGGNSADSNVIYSVLKNADVPKLELVVGTHAHEDHIGGLSGAFNYTTATKTLCPVTNYDSKAFNNFVKYASEKGGGITVPSVGDTYNLGSAKVEILGVNSNSETNNTSIVLKITYGKTNFLFTGDAEREAEQVILNSGVDLSATVLKVGHHGSDTSTTYPFLREVMPTYAVISVGEGNSYGHPTESTLSRLRDADVKVYRTDLQGDVFCTSDGTSVTFTTDKNTDIDTLSTVGHNSTQKAEPAPEPSKEPVPEPSAEPSYEPEPSAEPSYEPEPEPTPAPVPQEDMVWIPNSGSKYHSHSGCSGMKNPSEVTLSKAKSLGFTACKRCY